VVQTWLYHADLVGGGLARLAGKQTVVWGIHHSDLEAGRMPQKTRFVARICSLLSWFVPKMIVCCSEKAAAVHVSLGYNSSKMAVVSNGINASEFKPNMKCRSKLRNEWGIREEEVLLGMVARWDKHKDHANLAAALAHLKLLSPQSWRCILVGSGMDEANRALVSLLEERGVRDRFILAGLCNDIPALMNVLDLHVLSSSGEAFGIVTIEAMASGVPAVVTSVGAGEFIVGETGWVVPPSKPEAMSGAIFTAINEMANQGVWAARKSACRTRVVEKFSLERMVAAYRAVWNAALQKDTHWQNKTRI